MPTAFAHAAAARPSRVRARFCWRARARLCARAGAAARLDMPPASGLSGQAVALRASTCTRAPRLQRASSRAARWRHFPTRVHGDMTSVDVQMLARTRAIPHFPFVLPHPACCFPPHSPLRAPGVSRWTALPGDATTQSCGFRFARRAARNAVHMRPILARASCLCLSLALCPRRRAQLSCLPQPWLGSVAASFACFRGKIWV